MSSYSSYSESDDEPIIPRRFFGRQRNMHQILGGGKVANILLWENKNLSAGILIGFTVIWFLFEVAEYNFITLLCHTSIIVMIIMFLWSTAAAFFDWSNPPDFMDIRIPEERFRWLFGKINWLFLKFYDISSGKDFRTFFLAISFLWVLSVTGSNFSSLNLLYLGFLSLMTLPAFYEHYEDEVNHLAIEGSRDLKRLYRKFDANVLSKIPRAPVRSKKTRFLF